MMIIVLTSVVVLGVWIMIIIKEDSVGVCDRITMKCPICEKEGKTSRVKFIGHHLDEIPWDYDEDGTLMERAINVRIECSEGHKTDAQLRGVLDKAQQA